MGMARCPTGGVRHFRIERAERHSLPVLPGLEHRRGAA